jgi:hypothetical protein
MDTILIKKINTKKITIELKKCSIDPRKTLMIISLCVSPTPPPPPPPCSCTNALFHYFSTILPPTPPHINAPQKLMGLKFHNLMVLKFNSTNWLILLELMYKQPLEE